MTTYLVTGGAGFIGSNIAHALLNNGEKVKVLDNFSTGKMENICSFLNDIELIEGDFTDEETVEKALKGIDIIFHQGAIPSVPKSIKNPLDSNHANVTGTLLLLQGAVKNKVSRFIYAASSSAYGNTDVLPKKEDMQGSPMSPYAVSKYAGEHYCKAYHEIHGLETISLRYFNVFGPKQDPYSEYAAVIPKFIDKMLRNESPTIFGDGTQSRDFTYIDNVVSANLLAAEAPKLSGNVVNIGCGQRYDLNYLVTSINNILEKNVRPNYQEGRVGDVKHSLADIQLAKHLLNYEPLVSFEEGLRKTIKWYKKFI
ncbi:UDP-glucose 4-epimerase [Evansella vedderi]|uniref:UDP-glucose 4-epimerase n=1 Tax=Evansella vedderi TaxID=38282 RepID=A0ABT9ZVP4_9BACI|nr:SDR family oxidoreductase [Evansella vedderi]MDQ0255316.1 UDP-glucose 4-epimerase [Evansella vedderi]